MMVEWQICKGEVKEISGGTHLRTLQMGDFGQFIQKLFNQKYSAGSETRKTWLPVEPGALRKSSLLHHLEKERVGVLFRCDILHSYITEYKSVVAKITPTGEKHQREETIYFSVPHHQNVVKQVATDIFDFRGQPSIYIAMNQCFSGNLDNHIKSQVRDEVPFDAEKYLSICCQIVMGLKYLHSCNVVHRDPKLENVLWHFKKSDAKLYDFGLSRTICGDKTATQLTSPHTMNQCSSGNLDNHIKSQVRDEVLFDAEKYLSISRQIVAGLKFLHLCNVVHRDLKPENVFWHFKKSDAKLYDFGLSKTISGDKTATQWTSPHGGTVGCKFPEVLIGATEMNVESDIFALSLVTFYCLSYEKHPYSDKSYSWNHYIMEAENRNLVGMHIPDADVTKVPLEFMLQQNSADRPAAKEVLKHSIIVSEGLKYLTSERSLTLHTCQKMSDDVKNLLLPYTLAGDEETEIVERTFNEEVTQVKVTQPTPNRQKCNNRDGRYQSQNSQQTSHQSSESSQGTGLYYGDENNEALSRPIANPKRLPAVEADGRVSDDVGDPPGQQSVYVTPGDVRREDYRLSTFERFPVTCPISRKSLSRSGFYFTGFYDRVKCFACGRTVDQWQATDNPAELRWHKPSCPLPRGGDCGNIPMMRLFQAAASASNIAGQELLEQRDAATGVLTRTVRYPSDLPQRIRQTGGTFDIGAGSTLIIQNGPGSPSNVVDRVGSASVQQRPARRWRMANVVSGDVRRFLTNLYLNRELDRVASFARWPVSRPTISPAFLAKSGFFYLGDMDRTQCFSCGGVLRNWTLEDDAFAEHRSHFPQCLMVLGTETRNVPVQEHPETQQERDTNYPCRFPVNPHMRSEAGRIETFDRRWQSGRTSATPAEISQAGFFFLGERDRVKCWYCNGGLQNWEYDDIPWVEHAKWFPNCQFLLKVKGQHFVYRHLAPHPHLARPIITRQDGSPLDAIDQPSQSRDVAPRGRSPTPPPTIIDPRAEMNKRKEKVKNIMQNSELVNCVLTMGFEAKIVEALLEDRLNSGSEVNSDDIYGSVSELLDDVMKKEEELKREEEEARGNQASSMNSAVAIAAAGPSSFGTVSSIYSSMSGSSMMSSLGPAPGSGKYNVSYYDEYDEDEMMEQDMYGSEGPDVVNLKQRHEPADEPISASLQETLNKMEEEKICKICFSNPADMVFIPCGHMCCCMECTQALRHCPMCRKQIEKAMKTYTQ